MNYTRLSEREKQRFGVCRRASLHRVWKLLQFLLIGSILFWKESPLFSPSHPPLPRASDFLARQTIIRAWMLSFWRIFRCVMVKAGREGMLALGLRAKGTCFSTCLPRLGNLSFFFLFSVFLLSLLICSINGGRNSDFRCDALQFTTEGQKFTATSASYGFPTPLIIWTKLRLVCYLLCQL